MVGGDLGQWSVISGQWSGFWRGGDCCPAFVFLNSLYLTSSVKARTRSCFGSSKVVGDIEPAGVTSVT